ncbi:MULTISPECIES: hypothetical protein [unclassified Halomonas]|uniref:pilus assembly PilX family protein n=1 Tax=unclassified Halomonas TaxID=2609666 RepID=UPI00209D63C5|nr:MULTISPECIES: hypothetical protein [unclassified Halomonas]MCP1314005.1 hypothetical protein [Halomonas sp. 707D7]MCP1327565.1 hypothetical protein [Halomonas sp. 707D4]
MPVRRPEPGSPTRQRGAALAIVIVVMASALMLGIVGVQSALIDQRLAANYRAALQAQMRAERAAGQALTRFDSLAWEQAPAIDEQPPRWSTLARHPAASFACAERSCLYLPVLRGGERWALAFGVVHDDTAEATLIAHSEAVFVRVEQDGAVARVRWE